VVVLCCNHIAWAQVPLEDWPAEERRLNPSLFRTGLKERGLTEILELHLRDYPPRNPISQLLLKREIKLAQYADPALDRDERQAAIAEANRLLEQLIDNRPNDPRRIDWQLTLAHSLIYQEGDAYIKNVLYRGGGSAEDRQYLVEATERAIARLEMVRQDIIDEYDRIDSLPIGEFETLERRGYIEQLDQMAPRADYLLLWALVFDSLPRDDFDPVRARRLNQVLEILQESPAFLETPHEQSKVQVQTLLLTGMTHRMRNDHRAARDFIERALSVANRLGDPAGRADVEWAATLARFQLILNEAESGAYDSALYALDRYRALLVKQSDTSFDLKLALALLERRILQERAQTARRAGNTLDALQYRTESWQALVRLVRREPSHRDEIYASVYHLIEPTADPESLDPFEQSAVLARLLYDADQLGRQPLKAGVTREHLLDSAIAIADGFLAEAGNAEADLVPEVLFNSAVALYERGRALDAARRFLQVGREYTRFDNALRATVYSVEICAELYKREEFRANDDLRTLYLEALHTLMTEYPGSEEAKYWRFFYGLALEGAGRFDAAASTFALVGEEHDHHLESVFFRVRCLFLGLQRAVAQDAGGAPDIRQRIAEFREVHRDFISQASAVTVIEEDSERVTMLRRLMGEATVIRAEVQLLPPVDRPVKALDVLASFEQEYPEAKALIGRAMRVRLLAYEELGRLDEATKAIPSYVESDPDNAGPTLQKLYTAMVAEFEKLESRGDMQSAQRKAETALLLAQQINAWVDRSSVKVADAQREAVKVQLAEANLRVGNYRQAGDLFAGCLGLSEGQNLMDLLDAESSGSSVNAPLSEDPRLVLVYAESLFHMSRYEEVLPVFNHLATKLPADNEMYWQSLLRDLQCRTELNHAPEGIIKVIEQQRFLHRDLGGPKFEPQFVKLLRQNRKRLAGG
jgi:hypothetical protein